MTKLVKSETISLAKHPEIKESAIQEFIFNDPSVLGLGDLIPVGREKTQPGGGRIDMLLSDTDAHTRYEVEIQLGATDPSHIIRTIEYWDKEKKALPTRDHCAVIIAEKITGRFMNVISLFNGTIPLIAIQMTASKNGDDIQLHFTKVLDRIVQGTEEDEAAEVTDRNYWEKCSTTRVMNMVDRVFNDLGELTKGYELKYNKFYIGLAKDGVTKNFISFKPKKSFMHFCIKADKNELNELGANDFEELYDASSRQLKIKINRFEEYEKHRDLFQSLVSNAKKQYEGPDD